MNGFPGPAGEHRQENQTREPPNQDPSCEPCPEQAPPLTRVQIQAVISGELSGPAFGPDLLDRLHRLCGTTGKRLHSLLVEVVQMPVICPTCGQHALFRCQRKGFLQTRLYPVFGLYPWSCTCCRRACLLRLRRPPVLRAIPPEQPAAAARPKAA